MEFDYIICGGGSAGCVLAARLSEDPGVTVCLIEAVSAKIVEKVTKATGGVLRG